jgi:RNA polymerase sigma-70 factor (ECF subfamily)
MDLHEELQLLARAQAGDKEALALLWDAVTPKLYGYLINQLRHKDLAEDICQETWLKAIKHLHTFKNRGVRFSAWVFAIARNECRQYWRGGNKEISVDMGDENFVDSVRSVPSTDYLLIESALGTLSAEEKEIIELRYIADLSFKEIAAILEISMVAARVRVHRALSHARAIIK